MSRFVVLIHETPFGSARPTHWDFMFAWDDALRTWALAKEPHRDCIIAAEALADHRMAYLDYEGPISGDRGHVSRWDRGDAEVVDASAASVELLLHGERISGRVTLARLAPHNELNVWQFHWHAS